MEEMSREEMVEWEKSQGGQELGDLDRNVREQVLHGCDLAQRLQSVVNSAEGQDLRQFTAEFCREIVASFSKALYLLNSVPSDWGGDSRAVGEMQSGEASIQRSHWRSELAVPGDSPRSGSGPRSYASGSPPSDMPEDRRLLTPPIKFKGGNPAEGPDSPTASKNKKLLPRWSRRVPANSPQSGIDVPPDDGYAWRKYGQKDIFGAQYPRSYYRCTHKNDMGCQATKQVQRAEDDPSFFDVNYRGLHSCRIDRRLPQMPQIDSSIPSSLFFGANPNLPSEASGVHGISAAQFNLSSSQPNSGSRPESLYISLLRRQENEGDHPIDLFPLQSDQRGAFNEGELGMTISASESNYIPLSPAMALTHSMEDLSARGQRLQGSEPDNTRDVSGHASADDSPMLDMDVIFNVDLSELQL